MAHNAIGIAVYWVSESRWYRVSFVMLVIYTNMRFEIDKTMRYLRKDNRNISPVCLLNNREEIEKKGALGVGVALENFQTFCLRIPRLKSFIINIQLEGA